MGDGAEGGEVRVDAAAEAGDGLGEGIWGGGEGGGGRRYW